MSQRHLSLNVLNVPSPCPVPWKSMAGTAQVRFCAQCRRNVYNLSTMTAAQAESLLRAGDEATCVRFYRRFDGTVVTTDRCTTRTARTWSRIATAVAAVFIGLASLAGCDCSKLGLCTQGKIVPRAGATTSPPAPADEDEESN